MATENKNEKLTPEEKKQKKLQRKIERKNRKARKIARCRGLKNFGWFLFGFLFNFIVIFGSLFVAVKFIPLKTYFGEEETALSTNVQDKSIWDVAFSLDSYTVADFPIIVDTLEDAVSEIEVLDGLVEFNFDAIRTAAFTEVPDKAMDVVKVVATLKKVQEKFGFDLGSIGEISILKDWEEVPEEDRPTEIEEGDETLYYYCTNEGSQIEAPTYAKAIENGAWVNGVTSSTKLYYPAILEAPLLDALSLLPARLMDLQVTELLEAVGMEVEEGSMIDTLLGGKTIAQLGDGLDLDSIKLSTFGISGDLLTIINNALPTPKANAEDITVADLSDFEMDNFKLSTVVEYDGNESMFTLIKEATGFTGNAQDITVSALSSFNPNNIRLTSVGVPSGVIDILCGALTTSKTASEVTVNDLTGFNVSNLKLSAVVAYTGNESMYAIIKDATGFTGNTSDITVSALSNFNADSIHLSSVMTESDNAILSALLTDTTVTLGNLGTKVNNLDMSAVYPATCFEVDNSNGIYYLLEDDSYVLATAYTDSLGNRADDNSYKVSNQAGVWLLMYYTSSSEVDANGNPQKYTIAQMTVGNLQTSVGNIGTKFQNATVRQLVDAGIITGTVSPLLMNKTISQVLNPVA